MYASEKFQGTSEGGRYGDTIEEIDWSVGRILSTLKEEGLDQQTLVIFTSDNGPWLIMKDQSGTAGPLRDGKASHYEGGFRVPCIMWGSMVQPGHVTSMGSSLDFIPTFCEMAGVELPTDRVYDGVSLVPVLKDSSVKSPRNEFFFYRGGQLFAVRKGRYKLHFKDAPAYGSNKITVLEQPVLYDLGADPEEKFDLAAKHPEIVQELTELAQQHQASFTPAEPLFDVKATKK